MFLFMKFREFYLLIECISVECVDGLYRYMCIGRGRAGMWIRWIAGKPICKINKYFDK